MASDESSEEKHSNYMKVMKSLMLAKEGLETFTDTEMKLFHAELRFHIKTSESCGECLKHVIEQQWRKGSFSCIKNICDKWLSRLHYYHMRKEVVNIAWNHIDISKLPTSVLECAKVFFNPKTADISQDVGKYLRERDLAALLKLYLDCLYFQDKVNREGCKEVQAIRNTLMHSGTMEIETSQMHSYITTIVSFLEDPAKLAKDIGCMRAADKIKQMRDRPLPIWNVSMEMMIRSIIKETRKESDKPYQIMEDSYTAERFFNRLSYSRKESSQIKSTYTPTLDGRLRNLPKTTIASMIDKAAVLTEGYFGTTYLCHDSNSDHPKMVIKKIVCKAKRNNGKAYIQEMLVPQFKHPGIVPLFAGTLDEEWETYYFVLPYLEKGDLRTALKEDHQRIIEGKTPLLTKEVRRRILLQLALILQFFNKRSYIHGAVTTKNIVLDAQLNIRLLGLSKNVTEHIDVAEYRPRNNPKEISEKTDIFSYSVVVLEIITGQPPINKDGLYLHEDSDVFMHHYDQIKHIWGENALPRDLNSIANDCKKISTAKQIESSAKQIESVIHTLEKGVNDKFHQIQETPPKCNLCMKNHVVDRSILKHDCDVRFCVACIRCFYPNPIQCPLCLDDIVSPIGVGWGAILVAGNAKGDSALANSFKKGVNRVKKSITSMRQLAMGLREDGVSVVQMDGPVTADGLLEKLKTAVDRFKSDKLTHIHTLILYFSGHGTDKHQLVLSHRKETITDKMLIDMILQANTGVTKILTILDCCHPDPNPFIQDLSRDDIKIIKLLSCDADEAALCDRIHGTAFTNLFVQCLTGRNAHEHCKSRRNVNVDCEICQDDLLLGECDDGFISIEYLEKYIGKHMEKDGCNVPVSSKVRTRWYDSKLAFCLPELPIEIFNEKGKSYRLNELPDSIDELMDKLLEKTKDTLAGNRREHFKDIYSIVTKTGPGPYDTLELLNVEQIESAINVLHRIYVVPRIIKHINQNRSVGIFLDNEEFDSQAVIDCIKCLWNKECSENDNVLDVAIPLKIPGKKRNRKPPQVPDKHKKVWCFLSKILDVLINTLNKNGDVQLLLRFPYKYKDSRTDVENKFFIIRLL